MYSHLLFRDLNWFLEDGPDDALQEGRGGQGSLVGVEGLGVLWQELGGLDGLVERHLVSLELNLVQDAQHLVQLFVFVANFEEHSQHGQTVGLAW